MEQIQQKLQKLNKELDNLKMTMHYKQGQKDALEELLASKNIEQDSKE